MDIALRIHSCQDRGTCQVAATSTLTCCRRSLPGTGATLHTRTTTKIKLIVMLLTTTIQTRTEQ